MDDDFIQKLEEVWNKITDILKSIWERFKEFAEKLYSRLPKEEPKTRDRDIPKIIKCIGQPLSGYSTRLRTRTRNSC